MLLFVQARRTAFLSYDFGLWAWAVHPNQQIKNLKGHQAHEMQHRIFTSPPHMLLQECILFIILKKSVCEYKNTINYIVKIQKQKTAIS